MVSVRRLWCQSMRVEPSGGRRVSQVCHTVTVMVPGSNGHGATGVLQGCYSVSEDATVDRCQYSGRNGHGV
jgi:hypothetical protein